MDCEERLKIAFHLQKYHYFFRVFWDLGNPRIVDDGKIKTAAIVFDTINDKIHLTINRDFWNGLNEHSKLFLICHEILHVVLKHGERFSEYFNTPDFERMNVAADVVINEMLCKSFGFDRNKLNDKITKDGCWFNTVFKNKQIEHNQSTEFYFNYLKDNNLSETYDHYSIDSHETIVNHNADITEKVIDSGILTEIDKTFIDKITKSIDINGKDAEIINENIEAGIKGGNISKNVELKKIKKKRKWESVIKRWSKNITSEVYDLHERWERKAPLYSYLLSDNIKLPSNVWMVGENKIKNKLDVYFFLDTSGSCAKLAQRFFDAARSLDPKKFNVKLLCFDTKVYEVDSKNPVLYGFGGTSFSVIETWIQSYISKNKSKYPNTVWIITDGYGNDVKPEHPERWNWFLSENFTNYIPHKSNVYFLKDFE